MNWDDLEPKAKPQSAATLGEDLSKHALAELEQRIIALNVEIDRVRAEIERRRKQSSAADALFRKP